MAKIKTVYNLLFIYPTRPKSGQALQNGLIYFWSLPITLVVFVLV
jgi:hypothetical protein